MGWVGKKSQLDQIYSPFQINPKIKVPRFYLALMIERKEIKKIQVSRGKYSLLDTYIEIVIHLDIFDEKILLV